MKKIALMSAASVLITGVAFANMDVRPTALPVSVQDRTEEEFTRQLRDLGYTNMKDQELRGDIYTATAYWKGKPLSIRVDGESGFIQAMGSEAETIRPNPDATPEAITAALEGLGYDNVHDMTKSGDVYRAKAQRGDMVYMVRVDAETGIVTNLEDRTQPTVGLAERMSDAEIVSNLADLGYKNGHDVTREGNVISVKAWHSGETVDLNIDARNGAVTVVN